MSTRRTTLGARASRRDGGEALEVGAFGEADGVVDGMAGAVDLVHRAAVHRPKEVRGAHSTGATPPQVGPTVIVTARVLILKMDRAI